MNLKKVTIRIVGMLITVLTISVMNTGCSNEDCELPCSKTLAKRSRSRSGEIIKETDVYVDRDQCRDSACIVTGFFTIKEQAFLPNVNDIEYIPHFQMTTNTNVMGCPNDTEVTWEWEEIGYENFMRLNYDFEFFYSMRTIDYNVKGDSIGYLFKRFSFHYQGGTIVELKNRKQ